MSYCVNCGVELAPSEKSCPLCDVPVINPKNPQKEPEHYPYPGQFESETKPVNRKYGAYLATILLAVPMLLSVFLDLFDATTPTWCPYVLGAGCVLFCMVLLPFYIKRTKPYFFLAVDTVIVGLYICLIGLMSGGIAWVVNLALPLTLVVGSAVIGAVYLARRDEKTALVVLSDIAFILCAVCVLIEMLVDAFIWNRIFLTWSLYTGISLVAVGVIFRIIERKEKLKEGIIKRLYI